MEVSKAAAAPPGSEQAEKLDGVRVIVVGDLTGCELTLTIDEPALRPALE